MDIIELARNLGAEIQKDQRYLSMQLAIQATEDDGELQDLIGQYNLKRIALDNEMQEQKGQQNEKIQAYSQELRGLYETIMNKPSMDAYQSAKAEFDGLIRRVQAIVQQSADGQDPRTADYEESCGGDCAGCAGCH